MNKIVSALGDVALLVSALFVTAFCVVMFWCPVLLSEPNAFVLAVEAAWFGFGASYGLYRVAKKLR